MSDTPKTRTKNVALYAVEMPLEDGITIRTVAYVRSTSTAEAKAAVPITARRLGFDEAAQVLRNGETIMGMQQPVDNRQLDLVGKTASELGIPTQDTDHQGMLDKSDLPPAKTINEALAAGAKVSNE